MTENEILIEKLKLNLKEGEGTIIEHEYIDIVVTAFQSLIDTADSVNNDILISLADILESVINRLLNTNDAKKTAQLVMARINTTPDLTMAHINWLLTIIGLAFKKGNQIILYIKKYNSRITNICNEQLANLASLAPYRQNEQFKQYDADAVQAFIESQVTAL